MEENGFKYFDDDEDSEELEERDASPENKRQRNLVAYFENSGSLHLIRQTRLPHGFNNTFLKFLIFKV